MLKFIPSLLALVYAVVLIVEDAFDGVPGAQKRTEAVAQIKTALASSGLTIPGFVTDTLLGSLVDVLVGVLNKVGSFRKAA